MSPEALDDKSQNQLKVAREPISRRSFQAGRAALAPQTRGRGAESASDCPRAGTRPGATWALPCLPLKGHQHTAGRRGLREAGRHVRTWAAGGAVWGGQRGHAAPSASPLLFSSPQERPPRIGAPPPRPPIGFSWVLSELKDLRGAGSWLSSQLPEAAWDPLARAPSSRREPAATCRQHLQGRLQEVRRAPGVFQARAWEKLGSPSCERTMETATCPRKAECVPRVELVPLTSGKPGVASRAKSSRGEEARLQGGPGGLSGVVRGPGWNHSLELPEPSWGEAPCSVPAGFSRMTLYRVRWPW